VVAASMAVLATLIATLVPAWRSAREDITKGLKDGSGAARGAGRAGRFFVIAEVALSCALLFGATLMLKSLINSQAVEIGAETDRVLTGRVALFESKYPDATAQVAYFEQLAQRLGALPGVTASGLTASLPGTVVNAQPYSLEGEPVVPGEARFAETVIADPGFFTVFGIKAREGRLLDPRDRADSQPAVVINQRFADLHWPGANALGKRIVLSGRTLTVVGVINDVQQSRVGQPIRPGMYLPLAQNPTRFMTAAFRTPDEPLALAEPFRDLLLSLDPDTPAYWVRSMDDWLERGTFGFNLHAMMFLVFAVIALTLAAVGLYAVLAHAVAQRTREFGIRRSLGADDRAVLGLVFGEAARFVGMGLAIGALLALGLGRLLSMGLFGVSGSDPTALALVVGVLGVVAVIAALVPARRALAVEPTVALREE
jgi:putative ABC transport system permease protein